MSQISETKNALLLASLNEEIQELHHRLYPDKFKPYNKIPIERAFEEMLGRGDAKAFVALHKGMAVGYVLVVLKEIPENPFQNGQKHLLVDQLVVLKEHRGLGIGKMLLDHALLFATGQGASCVQLNHWAANNEARSFFSKHGFSCCREIMERQLS